MDYQTPNNVGGYMCPRCGTWIANGTGHTCGVYPPQSQYVYNDTYYLSQIINLLEKILEKLEK